MIKTHHFFNFRLRVFTYLFKEEVNSKSKNKFKYFSLLDYNLTNWWFLIHLIFYGFSFTTKQKSQLIILTFNAANIYSFVLLFFLCVCSKTLKFYFIQRNYLVFQFFFVRLLVIFLSLRKIITIYFFDFICQGCRHS